MGAVTPKGNLPESWKSRSWTLGTASFSSLALVFWGWHTGLWLLALPMALSLEARHVIKQRWPVSLAELKSIAKFCGIAIGILAVVLLIIQRTLFIYGLLQWLPLPVFPLVVVQTYGVNVLELLRDGFSNPHLLRQGIHRKRNPINLHYLYFAICLSAASATAAPGITFYLQAMILSAGLFWTLRPRRSTPVLWLLLLCLAGGIGYGGHVQLNQFKTRLEARVVAVLSNFTGGAINPDRNSTAMGSVGSLKLSSQIAFRVAPNDLPTDNAPSIQTSPAHSPTRSPVGQSDFPLLLREATYNQFRLANWSALKPDFQPVPLGKQFGNWMLTQPAPKTAERSITISTNLKRGKGILTLPQGSHQIQQLPVEELEQNQYGAVRAKDKGTVAYQVQFTGNTSRFTADAAPTEADLQLPNADRPAIDHTLKTLNLLPEQRQGQSQTQIANQIAAYFQDFGYSLELVKPDANTTPISDFLLNTQTGHCEYFATATTLLLRASGIPARYAIGYSAHEFSSLEQQYIVRNRDAHAWTLAYLDGAWQTLDTTPANWVAQDRAKTSPFQVVSDFIAFLKYQFSLKAGQFSQWGVSGIVAVLVPVLGYLLWKFVREMRKRKGVGSGGDGEPAIAPPLQVGLDSEFYAIEEWLAQQALHRSPGESLLQWGARLRSQLPEAQWASLQDILALHYRYRFDPQCLSPPERQQLQHLSQTWLKQFQHQS